MNTYYRRLHLFVSCSISPEAMASGDFCLSDFERWKKFLHDSSCELRLLMSEHLMGVDPFPVRRNWMLSMRQHLTELSDQVNGYLHRGRKVWASNSNGRLIRSHYLLTLACFQDLLGYAALKYVNLFDKSLRMTTYQLFELRPAFRLMVVEMNGHLIDAGIDERLRALLLTTLWGVNRSKGFSPVDYEYYTKLMKAVLSEQGLTQQRLVELLISYNFNKPAFYVYIVRCWQDMLDGMEGLQEQVERLVHQNEEISSGVVASGSPAFSNHSSLKQDLLMFCRQKKEYLQELIALRKMAHQDEMDMREASRILSGFTVPQISLFLKLQVEKGLLVPDSLAGLYRFVSRHFYTSKALLISEKSLKREYEDVKFSTAYKMYLVFLDFIEWLDELFQVKSFKPA